ncbi:MAG: hypothetical protein LBC87_06840 [Fibromonadaceae bacterium]|jgi:hypothetical protein|nr:hypothetical protein [Fibromonadaceae bacterium]
MAVRVKPVQATVVRDVNIARQIIAEVRRTPSPKRLAELKKLDKIFKSMIKDDDE